MSKLDQQFYEDRALRDAAREVLMADIAHAKVSLSGKGIAGRVAGRVGDGAKDVFEVAKVHSDDNRGIIAALIGALVLWFTRAPILEILGLEEAEDQIEATPEDELEDAETDSEQLHTDETTPEPPPPGDSDD
ncbi:hypothetical protein [Erythrobacter crassostreae]|uniref:Uncharacterized protein n=1 Tax=Erythrobacter crassostreae TaxID=2828328 RepID=A0A9X1F4E7_9SPHN|nr:hypothetical protein [Erythrobacter crassostrea]MBV7259922.1 hypothetical protein [Erythrobacter crassostrea]